MDRELTPAMRQYVTLKARYPDSLLLLRMGDFYELFFEDAKVASRVLDIALTTREKGKEDPIPMCGVPYHSVDAYIEKLLKAGYKVAIAEQLEDPKKAKGVVKRDVVRVITPSTAIEIEGERGEGEYLASLWKDGKKIGAVFANLATGQVLGGELSQEEVLNFLSLLSPKEVLANFPIRDFPLTQVKEAEGKSPLEKAYNSAVNYLSKLRGKSPQLLPMVSLKEGFFLDSTSVRNLEIFSNLRDGTRRGSLIQVLDMTLTPMGARMLRHTLRFPLRRKEDIEERLEGVSELYENNRLREALRSLLGDLGDLDRVAARARYDVAGPRDLVALKQYLKILPSLKESLKDVNSKVLSEIRERIKSLPGLVSLLERALVDEPPYLISQGGVIRKGFHPELDQLREISRNAKALILSLEEEERRRTGIKKLRIGFNKVFGYFIEVPKSQASMVPADYIRKQTLVNSERFITPKIKEMEEKILHAEERIKELEEALFREIREKAGRHIEEIRENSRAIGELDLLLSFAEVARKRGYTRPRITHGKRLVIKEGRHPVVEVLKRAEVFVPNDTYMDDKERILIITGPNMGGKSTYLRQVALISLLAHCGSFVPAKEAEIPLMDRIFTRIGASDYLAGGESTFMVEMKETAEILSKATERSLVILDEIGRGTSTYDGISIAWAVVEYIHDKIGAKTLFATHYYELTDLEDELPGVVNYHIKVSEWQGNVVFLYELERGRSEKSYGIHVAKLARVPDAVIKRAWEVLEQLEKGKGSRGRDRSSYQPSLFEEQDQLREFLSSIDPERLTPLQALEILFRLKKML